MQKNKMQGKKKNSNDFFKLENIMKLISSFLDQSIPTVGISAFEFSLSSSDLVEVKQSSVQKRLMPHMLM